MAPFLFIFLNELFSLWLLRSMSMKQDIWSIYFQTRIKNGFNVPEPADPPLFVHKSVSPGRSECLPSVRLCSGVASVLGGEEGLLMGTEGGGG